MNDIVKIGLTLLLAIVVVLALGFGITSFMVKMSTVTGSFVIIPETGQPFHVKKVTFMSSHSVAYEKTDGTGGRISGNFRVEDAISQILEKTQEKQ